MELGLDRDGNVRTLPTAAAPSPEALRETAKRCFDRAVEVYKARLNVELFLALVTMTLTGYALQAKRAELLFLTAAIPLLCLVTDLALKSFATPFLYKALLADYQISGEDSEVLLFLQFPATSPSPYVEALQLPSELDRRRRFRALFVRRNVVFKTVLFGTAAGVEVAMGLWLGR